MSVQLADEQVSMHEEIRFVNQPLARAGELFWDLEELWQQTLAGLQRAASRAREAGEAPAGVAVDSSLRQNYSAAAESRRWTSTPCSAWRMPWPSWARRPTARRCCSRPTCGPSASAGRGRRSGLSPGPPPCSTSPPGPGTGICSPGCQLIADTCALEVVAGPAEATSLGNALIQAWGRGEAESAEHIRQIVRNSHRPSATTRGDLGDPRHIISPRRRLEPDR
jgi:hypothetical protein